jgi:FtsP/CotA-like multicopper oxidase with cupredoxin domain
MKWEFAASRRTFIKAAAILGGLGALLGIGEHSAAAKAPPSRLDPAARSGQGYRLTEHVKRYYETARL